MTRAPHDNPRYVKEGNVATQAHPATFTEHEGRLLLAAVYRARQQEPKDEDWIQLYEKLHGLWGDTERVTAVTRQKVWVVGAGSEPIAAFTQRSLAEAYADTEDEERWYQSLRLDAEVAAS